MTDAVLPNPVGKTATTSFESSHCTTACRCSFSINDENPKITKAMSGLPTFDQWEFSVSGETQKFTVSKRCGQTLYFSRRPSPLVSPFCASIQISRDPLCAGFTPNEKIKGCEQAMAAHSCGLRHLPIQALPHHGWRTLQVAGGNWSHEVQHCGDYHQRYAQHLRKIRPPHSSRHWQRAAISVHWIRELLATKRRSTNIGLLLPSILRWTGGTVRADLQERSGIISIGSIRFTATANSKLPAVLQEHRTRHNQLIPCQTVSTARAANSSLLRETWPR